MNVKGYIYGKGTHSSPASPQKGDKNNPRISRQAVAGKARVGVPPTKLSSQPFPRLANLQPPEREENVADAPQYETNQEQQQTHNGSVSPGKHGDMFDTDVEGIDDSTIASGSVVFGGDENQPYQSQPPSYQEGINRGLNPQSRHPQNLNDLRGWADRIASELPSDSEESGGDDQETQRLAVPPAGNGGSSDAEHAQEYDMGGNMAPNGGTASSRIEAALRETGRRPGLRQPYPMPPSFNRGSLPPFTALPQRQDIADTQANYTNQQENPPRSQSPGNIPIRGRFNRNHRLLDSYPSQPRLENDAIRANNSDTQLDQRAASNREVPRSPVRTSQTNPSSPRKTARPAPLAKPNTGQGAPNSKLFDLTDLSALDDSSEESNDQPSQPAPSQRQKRSSATPQRPIDAYDTDYPSEVLLAKPFSDLKSESFDFNPSQSKRTPINIYDELPNLKNLTADQRRDFFSSLTIDEWEECGDLLIEQFGTILQNVKNVRHERRKVAAVFEKEIERRYGDVESKAKDLDKRLVEMRTGGLEVLNGRTK